MSNQKRSFQKSFRALGKGGPLSVRFRRSIIKSSGGMEGSVVKIHLENFITFRKLTVSPNKYFNLVTGPNGTGKSSLMCALCLGLGGKPKVVGRATNVSEYIRYNAESAKIELELRNRKGPNHKISRTITRDNKSVWTMNGFSSNQKDVEKLVLDLNIHVDNLCQFLPQDRVQDFAKMNCQTLMENTEKAVGGLKMWENHMKLKQYGNDYLDTEKNLSTKKEHMAHEEQIFASLQVAVDKLQAKKTLQDKLDRLQQKQAYKQYLKFKDDLDMSEKLLREKVAVREALEIENRPLQLRVTNEKRKILDTDEKIKNTGLSFTKLNKTCEEQFELPESINDKIRENVNEFERWCANEKKHQEKLKDARRQIDFLENTIKEMADSEDGFRKQDAKLIAEEKEIMQSIFDLQKERQTLELEILNIEHEIKTLEAEISRERDSKEAKLRKLKSEGLYEPIMWFRDNRHKLKGVAYEPMAMVINMKADGMAKYLENIVPRRDLVAFICEDPEDANFLMEELRDKRNYKVNVITSKPTTSLASFTRPYNLEDLRRFGFHSFVSDIFTAPETVKRYLFQNYNLHRIPIGDETTFAKANEVPSEIRTFMTANNRFTTRISKYTREVISSSTDLKDSVYLISSVNEPLVRECVQRRLVLTLKLKELQNNIAALEPQDKNFDEKLQNIKKSRSEIKGSLSKISSCQSRLANLKRTEKDLKERRNNEEEEKKKLEKKNQDCTAKLLSALKKNISNLKKYSDIILLMQLEQKESQKARHNVYLLEQDLRINQKKIKEAEKDEYRIRRIVDEAQQKTKKYLLQMEEYCRAKITSHAFKNILKDFEQLPDTLADIEREIHVTQTKAECLGHSDNNALAEYERRKKTLAVMKVAVEQLSKNLATSKKKIDEVKSEWFPFVSDLVSKINKKFGDLLAKINYVGEVLLVEGQHENDFANYGFKIQVKFRQEGGLQELNQFRQSGGERAVAIAIYLMSLQELTSVPFRCVDEINQGMDEFHESVVFKLLSGIVTGSGSAQYFLFTPKVLKNLEFPRELLFICVNNGEVECEECYNCRDFLNSRRSIQK